MNLNIWKDFQICISVPLTIFAKRSILDVSQGCECASEFGVFITGYSVIYPANMYLFKVNNRNSRKSVKYVQS